MAVGVVRSMRGITLIDDDEANDNMMIITMRVATAMTIAS